MSFLNKKNPSGTQPVGIKVFHLVWMGIDFWFHSTALPWLYQGCAAAPRRNKIANDKDPDTHLTGVITPSIMVTESNVPNNARVNIL